jgi:hypothetical protein
MNPMGGTITGGNPNDPGFGITSPGAIGSPGGASGPALPPSSLLEPPQTSLIEKFKKGVETGGKYAGVGSSAGSLIPGGSLPGAMLGFGVGMGQELLADVDWGNAQAPTGDPFGGFQGNQPSDYMQPMRPIDQAQPPSPVPTPGQPSQPAMGQYANRLTGQALTPEEFFNLLAMARQ